MKLFLSANFNLMLYNFYSTDVNIDMTASSNNPDEDDGILIPDEGAQLDSDIQKDSSEDKSTDKGYSLFSRFSRVIFARQLINYVF